MWGQPVAYDLLPTPSNVSVMKCLVRAVETIIVVTRTRLMSSVVAPASFASAKCSSSQCEQPPSAAAASAQSCRVLGSSASSSYSKPKNRCVAM